MRDIRTYKVFPSNLSWSTAFHESDEILSDLGYAESNNCPNIQYSLKISDSRTILPTNWCEFIKTIDRYPNAERVYVHSHWTSKDRKDVEVFIQTSAYEIEITVGSDDPAVLELLHSRLQESFRASNPKPEKSQCLSRRSLKKTIFLARRFDKHGQQTSATVTKFLSRCGFSVIEGEGYEASRIPEKVVERIEKQDVLIAVFTKGDSTWITSEASFAHGRGKYIVFLAEEGVEVKKGIFGADYEHMTFPTDFVEKTFSDLIYALP